MNIQPLTVLVAQAKLKQAELDLERTVIKAPFDGVVISRKIQVGQRVAPGSALLTGCANFTVYMSMPILKKAN